MKCVAEAMNGKLRLEDRGQEVLSRAQGCGTHEHRGPWFLPAAATFLRPR